MERFGCRLARTLPRVLRNALALSLSLALTGAPACSRESAPPAATPSEAPAPAAATEAPPAEEPAAAEEEVRIASDDLKALVSPIALYPDPLLELVLQASAQPGQVVLASRFLDDYEKDSSRQPDPAWDTAIIGLLNTPDVVQMMNESLDWTTELGQAVSTDLDDVQLAVQELRWSAFNMGALESNEYQEVVATGGVIAIMPAEREKVAVPRYDGAALLESAAAAPPPPAQGTGGLAPAQPSAGESYGTAPGYAYTPVPVSYAAPQPSFWSSAAVFAGGAALGGLLGYAIGSNDDDDDDDWHGYRGWGWDDDWDNRPWRGGGYRGGHNDINISGNTIIRPARPGSHIRPNRPITRPGGGYYGKPGRPGRPGADYGKPGRPGGRPPGLSRPVVGDGGSLGRPGGVGTNRPGRPGSGVGAQRPGRPGGGQTARPDKRPGAGRPGRGDAAQATRPRPPGVAPARPSGRPDLSTREVKMPRPDRAAAARPGGARPAERPAAAQRPAARPAQTRPDRKPDRGGALARNESRPRVERERARGQQSRTVAKPSRDRAKVQKKASGGNRSAMAKRGGGGGGGHKKAANRGKQSRKR